MLPPGLFVLALVVACVLMAKSISSGSRMRIAFVLTVFTALCIYLGSISPVTDMLIRPLENRYEPLNLIDAKDADAIVVLGGGIVVNSPEYEGDGSLRPDALKRAVYAAQLFQQLKLPLIVSGGRPLRGNGEAEAVVAARTLVSLGVPSSYVVKEEASRNTWENAQLIAKDYGFRQVVLVTSAYHMRRSIKAFRDNGMEPIPAPTDYKPNRIPYGLIDFFPNAGSLGVLYRALHEYIGMMFYAVRY